MKYLFIIVMQMVFWQQCHTQEISQSYFEKVLYKLEDKGEIQWRGNVIIFLTYGKAEIPFWKEMTKPMLDQTKNNPYVFAMLPRELRKKDGSYNTNDLIVLNENGRKAIAEMIADEKFYTSGKFMIRIEWEYRYIYGTTPTASNPYKEISVQPYNSDTMQQYWTFKATNDGYYKIINGIGKCLQLRNEVVGEKAKLITDSENLTSDAPAQKWKIISTDNDNYFLRSKTGMYLTIQRAGEGDNLETKFNVYAAEVANNENFRWQLIKVKGNNEVLTTYKPEINGFRFLNQFKGHDFFSWGGLCGGMVFSSLDYYYKKMPTPPQSWIPANVHPLQSYIWKRQQYSTFSVLLDKWAEYKLDVALTRRNEFFFWGTQGFGGGRLQEVRDYVRANTPLPMAMVSGAVGYEGSQIGDHIVLLYGYAMGRYTGNHQGHQQDYQIYIYDPNFGNRRITLIPNIAGKCYFELETGDAWLTYFLNNRYGDMQTNTINPIIVENFPEAQPNGEIDHLYIITKMGGDDLREGSTLNLTIHYNDGSKQEFNNLNNNYVWHGGSTQGVHLQLNKKIKKEDVKHFELKHAPNIYHTTFTDNVNIDYLKITTGLNGFDFANTRCADCPLPFHRFDSYNRVKIIPLRW